MSSKDKKWIVRSPDGHIYGPFSFEKLGDLLARSVLTGEEQISEYPVGDWKPMSSDPAIYDLVLEALSKPRTAPSKKDEPPMRDVTNAQEKSAAIKYILGQTKSKKLKSDEPPIEIPEKTQQTTKKIDVIELVDKTKLVKKQKKNFIPMVLVVIAGVLLALAFNVKNMDRNRGSVSLLNPQIKRSISIEKSSSFLKRGWEAFLKDTFTSYLKAQENFVQSIEENFKNSEALAMLAMTDGELWPFARQDSNDEATLQNLLELISKADPYGSMRAITVAAIDLIKGREASARSQIESSLLNFSTEGRLYALKAKTFYDSADFQSAISYYETAARLIPNWVKPTYMIGVCYGQLGNAGQAQVYLVNALKLNPNHSAARLELGIIESQYFNHDDRAKEYLTVALSSKERLLPLVEARGRFRLAVIYAKSGSLSKAKEEISKALALNPDDPEYKQFSSQLGDPTKVSGSTDRLQHMALGDQYMRTQNYLAAQGHFKAAFAADPKDARAAMRAAEALWKLRQVGSAFEYLQKSIVADPKFLESYALLASYRGQRYDFDGANRILEQALKVNPRSFLVYKGFAQLFLLRGDAKVAEVYASRALQLYSTDVQSNEIMAKIHLSKRDIGKAMQFAKRAVDLDRANPEVQVTYAKIISARDGATAGVDYLKELINTYPSQLAYRVGLADLLIQEEQFSTAQPILQQVIAADENNKDAQLLLGDAYLATENLDGALTSYLSAARADHSDPAGLFRAGEVYIKAGKFTEAQRQFQLVLKANPLFPRAHYSLAKAYFNAGDGQRAVQELEEEKKQNPSLADPYEFLGDVYVSLRQFSNASREYQKASELRPEGAAIYVKLAKAYRSQGNMDSALAMLRIASVKESGLSDIYREQGYIYEAKGMGEEAVTAFQQYLRLEPNPPDKATILGKIKELE